MAALGVAHVVAGCQGDFEVFVGGNELRICELVITRLSASQRAKKDARISSQIEQDDRGLRFSINISELSARAKPTPTWDRQWMALITYRGFNVLTDNSLQFAPQPSPGAHLAVEIPVATDSLVGSGTLFRLESWKPCFLRRDAHPT